MKEYIFLIIAALLFSVQFLFQKAYQRKEWESLSSAFLFSGIYAAVGMAYLLIATGFRLEFSLFSLGLAVVYGTAVLACTYCSVNALKNTDISTFSAFMMLGGMLLPFVSGLTFFHEPLTYAVFLCCALIILALLLEYLAKKGAEKKTLKYCFIVFILNGLCGVLSKTHEYFTAANIDSMSYMFYGYAAVVVIVFAYYLIKGKAPKPKKAVSLIYCGLYSAATTVANLLTLFALKVLPASVNYPFLTGGTMLFSTLIGVFLLKEKIKPLNVVAIAAALLAVVLLVVLPV